MNLQYSDSSGEPPAYGLKKLLLHVRVFMMWGACVTWGACDDQRTVL